MINEDNEAFRRPLETQQPHDSSTTMTMHIETDGMYDGKDNMKKIMLQQYQFVDDSCGNIYSFIYLFHF